MRNQLVYHLGYTIKEAVEYSPNGETAEEMLDRWQNDDDPQVSTPSIGDWWAVHHNVVLSPEEHAAVLAICALA